MRRRWVRQASQFGALSAPEKRMRDDPSYGLFPRVPGFLLSRTPLQPVRAEKPEFIIRAEGDMLTLKAKTSPSSGSSRGWQDSSTLSSLLLVH